MATETGQLARLTVFIDTLNENMVKRHEYGKWIARLEKADASHTDPIEECRSPGCLKNRAVIATVKLDATDYWAAITARCERLEGALRGLEKMADSWFDRRDALQPATQRHKERLQVERCANELLTRARSALGKDGSDA